MGKHSKARNAMPRTALIVSITTATVVVPSLVAPAYAEAPTRNDISSAARPGLIGPDLASAAVQPLQAPHVLPLAYNKAASAAIKTAAAISRNAAAQKAAADAKAAQKAAAAKAAAAAAAAHKTAVSSNIGIAALEVAETKIGKPYVWGASGPNAFDCSGLVMWSYKQIGVSLPRTSAAQSQVGTPVSKGDLRPGDLVFFYSPVSHVGIYVGDGKILNASTSSEPVKISNMQYMPFHNARRI